MAKKRDRRKQRAAADKRQAVTAAPTGSPRTDAPTSASPTPKPSSHAATPPKAGPSHRAPAEQPVFWFGFEVSWAKLALARFVIFGLLAVDALLQISHAPRYGAGGFNVAHVPGLAELGPERASYAIGQLVTAFACVFAACGVATRLVVPLAAVLYAWLYFGSQLDSYQHHYLVALVLVLACFVPWQRPADVRAGMPIRTWAIRLILVQLGIMYLWAAISKLDGAWLDGRTLASQLTGSLRSAIDGSIGFKTAARFTVLVELVLAVTVWVRPAWIVALPLGIAFHLGILASGLEIGLFAYLMFGFYLLLVPDRVLVWIAETPPLRALGMLARAARTAAGLGMWMLVGLDLGLGIVLARLCHLDYALPVAIALAAVPLALIGIGRIRPAVRAGAPGASAPNAYLVAILLWLAVDRSSTVAIDYYRFWGGNARRLGDPATSERAYRRLVEIAPDEPAGHYQLGRLLLARGDEGPGLAALHEAQRLEPLRARAWVAEASYLAAQGRTAEAREKAQEAVYSEPKHQGARDLLDRLSGARGTRDTPSSPPLDETDPP